MRLNAVVLFVQVAPSGADLHVSMAVVVLRSDSSALSLNLKDRVAKFRSNQAARGEISRSIRRRSDRPAISKS
jgi:hypothetical protein